MNIQICLILVIIKKIKSFFDPVNKKLLAKWKMNSRKKTNELVGLDSNMCSLIALDNKENNKAKGVKKMLLKKWGIKNILLFCLIRK